MFETQPGNCGFVSLSGTNEKPRKRCKRLIWYVSVLTEGILPDQCFLQSRRDSSQLLEITIL